MKLKIMKKTLNDFLKSANYDLNYFIEIVTSKKHKQTTRLSIRV